nr:biotin carboxylase N-terminal domain-containing protein [Pantoea stewartii]
MKIITAAQQSRAQAIHPGYGFLSENAALAEACESAGRIFIGPTPQQLRTFGLRLTARALAKAEDVPLLEGSELLVDVAEVCRVTSTASYLVRLKSSPAFRFGLPS